MKAPQIVPFRPSFAWYSIGQRHGQVHSRSRLPCVTVAPNGYKEQLLRSTTLFIILVKCGNCIHRRVTCPDDLLVENRGTGESLDYHITHSSLVKDPLPDSDPANQPKQISLSRWHASGGFSPADRCERLTPLFEDFLGHSRFPASHLVMGLTRRDQRVFACWRQLGNR